MAHRAWTQNSRKQRRATKKLRHRHLAPGQRLPAALSPPSSSSTKSPSPPSKNFATGHKTTPTSSSTSKSNLIPRSGSAELYSAGKERGNWSTKLHSAGRLGAPLCTRQGSQGADRERRVVLGREAKGKGKIKGKGRAQKKANPPHKHPNSAPHQSNK